MVSVTHAKSRPQNAPCRFTRVPVAVALPSNGSTFFAPSIHFVSFAGSNMIRAMVAGARSIFCFTTISDMRRL
jgi:hypothetical protein